MREFYSYWAKYKALKSHLLPYHSLDVASVASIWLENSESIRTQFMKLFNTDLSTLLKFIPFLSAIHDIGKLSHGFQVKVPEAVKLLKSPVEYKNYSKPFDHGRFGAFYIVSCIKESECFKSLKKEKLWEMLFVASCSHHGTFYKKTDYGKSKDTSQYKEMERDLDHIRQEFIEALMELFQITDIEVNIQSIRFTSVFIAGFISICDWLGSNENYFQYSDELYELDDYYKQSKINAKLILLDSGLLKGEQLEQVQPIKSIYPFQFRPVQEKVQAITHPGLMIIEAPTGEGKTESALIHLHSLLVNKIVDGAYFALPTRATANALYDRISSFLEKLTDKTVTLDLAHSSSWVKDSFKNSIIDFSQKDPYFETEANVVASKWLLNKRYTLLSQFGVGTIDQAMKSALNIKHFFVKMFGLTKGAVIFDEIHAYDSYMDTIIFRLIEWLGANQVPVIMLSATLPESKKKEFLKSYLGKNHIELKSQDYPLITSSSDTEILEIGKMEPAIQRTVALDYFFDDFELLIDNLFQSSESGTCTCVILNTVKRCQNLYTLLSNDDRFKDIDIFCFHSRFTVFDRNTIEKNTIDKFGKKDGFTTNPNRPKKAVLIATQVVEQSLDLDFDYMISDFAPIDLLIQRIGRLHRHKNERASQYKTPKLSLIINEINPGFHVYSNYIIYLSLKALNNLPTLDLPFCIRELINNVYPETFEDHPDKFVFECKDFSFNITKENIDSWLDKYQKDLSQQERFAEKFYIPNPHDKRPFKMDSYLDEEEANKDQLRASTRYGDGGFTLILLFLENDSVCTIDGKELFNNKNESLTPLFDDLSQDLQKSLFYSSISINERQYDQVKDILANGYSKQVQELLKKHPGFKYQEFLVLSPDSAIQYSKEMGFQVIE